MAMAAQKIAPEMFMEERTARLETNVEHIRSDISEMKVDIREIRGEMKEMDQRLTSKIEGVSQQLSARIDGVKDSVAALALATEKSFTSLKGSRMADRIWWIAISAGLLSVIARAFKWI